MRRVSNPCSVIKGKTCEWLDESIKRDMNLRDQLLRRARKVNNESSWKQYKLQRNKCTKRVRKAKATYHQQSLNENR